VRVVIAIRKAALSHALNGCRGANRRWKGNALFRSKKGPNSTLLPERHRKIDPLMIDLRLRGQTRPRWRVLLDRVLRPASYRNNVGVSYKKDLDGWHRKIGPRDAIASSQSASACSGRVGRVRDRVLRPAICERCRSFLQKSTGHVLRYQDEVELQRVF
jgi:hypothetical protein